MTENVNPPSGPRSASRGGAPPEAASPGAASPGEAAPGPELPPLRQAQIRQTEDRIIAAATELFLAEGYVATTLEAIARRAQVGARTVYVRFGTKAAVGAVTAACAQSRLSTSMGRVSPTMATSTTRLNSAALVPKRT